MRFGTLFILIFCNLIWSAHPLMGKYLLLGFSAQQSAWLRYASALVFYAAVFGAKRNAFLLPKNARDAGLTFALGFSAFCLSPLLQMTGLAASRAMDNSLIVAIEPLVTVLVAWLLLGERPTRLHFVTFAIALVGFALLTGLGPSVFHGLDAHVVGNLLLFYSLVGESLYSSLGRKLIAHHSPYSVFGAALFTGVLCLTFLVAFRFGGLPSLTQIISMPWQCLLAVLWMGPVGTGLGYLIWMNALKEAPVASLALTLFIQPVLGPLLGALFLGERLSWMQGFGSILILFAVFAQALDEVRRVKNN